MQRFVYTPRIEAFIRLEESGTIIDISDDIIQGNITLRLNAMSEAELQLQNKHGRYARANTSGGTKINPMDRIIIRMSRVGQPENVFAGYIDDAPHYQLYSSPVTIRASCILKLLQHTYFDPGLMALQSRFLKYGWVSDAGAGGLFNPQAWNSFDTTGTIKDLIQGILVDVANWKPDMIQIQDLPPKLITDISKIMVSEQEEISEEYQRIIKKLAKFFAVESSPTDVGGAGPGGAASPRSGNIPPEEIAQILLDEGLSQEMATRLVAISKRESGWTSDAINFNGGGDSSSNDGSYDFGLFQFNTIHAPGATNNGRGLSGPASSASKKELQDAVKENPQWVQDFYAQMSDPKLAGAKAARFAKEDDDLGAWAPPGGTWQTGISNEDLQQAAKAVQDAIKGSRPPDTSPIPGPDEGENRAPSQNTSYKLDHDTGGKPGWGAIDLMATPGTACYAVEGGIVTDHGGAVRRDDTPNGHSLTLEGESGQHYWYGHIEEPIAIGTKVYMGQMIAVVSANHEAPHLHIGFRDKAVGTTVTVPFPAIIGSGTAGGATNVGGVAGTSSGRGGPISRGEIGDIARQAFFSLQTGAFDAFASNELRGERAIANDISLMQWITGIITGAGRVFTSDAQGNFRAFFPDYFGIYGAKGQGQTPVWFVSEIEILDLTINQSDRDLTTHVFGTGPLIHGPAGIDVLDRLFSTVASVEKPTFEWFLTIDENKQFDPAQFLRKYGARPYQHDMPYLTKTELIWMSTWMKFLEFWSKRFTTNASFTFMPEIRPGWLINIGNRVQMFVESVTHSFNYTSGFTTSAQLTSAASLTDDITWLPRAGLESVLDELPTIITSSVEAEEPVD